MIISGVLCFLESATRIMQAILLGYILGWMTVWTRTEDTDVSGQISRNFTTVHASAPHEMNFEEAVGGILLAAALIGVAVAQIWIHHALV